MTKTKTEWRLVPVEPTKEMQKAALCIEAEAFGVAAYKAMLNAAPAPPASEPVARETRIEMIAGAIYTYISNLFLPKEVIAAATYITDRHAAKPCERCAELEDQFQFQAALTKELLPYQDEAVKSRAKIAALEAEKEEITQAIRWAPSSAHWSNVLIKLCGEDSRDGINMLEKQLREAQSAIAQQTKARKQAQADLETYKGRCTDLEHQNARQAEQLVAAQKGLELLCERIEDAAEEWAQYVEVDTAPRSLVEHMRQAIATQKEAGL